MLVNGKHMYAQMNDLVNIVLGSSPPLDLPIPLLEKAVLPPADLLLEIAWLEVAGTSRKVVERARRPPTLVATIVLSKHH